MQLVDERLDLGPFTLALRRPASPADLIDEERFADDEYMPYWSELWSAGVALAREAAARNLEGRRVLELGAGLGLPSIAAALRGAHVLATDWAPEALPLLEENAARNGARVETLACDWREPAPLAARGPWDLVLAADVLYEHRNVEPVAALLAELGAPALVADPGRPYLAPFAAATAERFRVEESRPDSEHPRLALLTLSP